MKKMIRILLVGLFCIILGCNNDLDDKEDVLYELVSSEYRIKEIETLKELVFNGTYDNKDHDSPIQVHVPIESGVMNSSKFIFPINVRYVKLRLPMIDADGKIVDNPTVTYMSENGVVREFPDSVSYVYSFEVPMGSEYKLDSFNEGYQIDADFCMKVKNPLDGTLSDISGEWKGIIYTANRLIVTNEKGDTINCKENTINIFL